jgi:pantoate--beta-alanine ligase
MNIVTNTKEWQQIRKQLQSKSIGFIPTMGHLHAGHLSLCQRARIENEIIVASIFVNPTQFNQTSDFDLYPRTLEDDIKILESNQVDYLFLPDAKDIYFDDYQLRVSETELSLELEGEFRPGHFNGMLTVVLKLLNLMQATHAYFGEKDFQQLLLINKMKSALFIPTEIVACKTIRAEDGLALSSRNSRLNAEQRSKAIHFPRLLQSVAPRFN